MASLLSISLHALKLIFQRLNIYGYLKFGLEHRPDKGMTNEQLTPRSEKLQSIKNRM